MCALSFFVKHTFQISIYFCIFLCIPKKSITFAPLFARACDAHAELYEKVSTKKNKN